ncbi:MAG: DNA-processing protein DprA [Candidatus Latescibacterota bacterium]
MVTREEDIAWIALGRLPGMNGPRCLAASDGCGSARQALAASPRAWAAALGELGGPAALPAPVDLDWAAEQWERLQRSGGRLLTLADVEYPVLLRQIAQPPAVLFVLGPLDLNRPCVAIVGPRRASHYGVTVARRLAREVAEAGICVVSGLAAGVDSAAHRGALDVAGSTVAVLGCGADVPYPACHAQLHAELCARGAVISEFPMGSRPERGSFPRRNRLISGLSLGVVLVETPPRSGALITARWAQEQGREVLVVPGSVLDGRSEGGHRMVCDENAELVTCAADVLRQLGHWSSPPRPVAGPPDPEQAGAATPAGGSARGRLSPEGRRVFGLLGGQPLHADQISGLLQMPPSDLHGALLELELEGLVAQLPGGRFVRVSP